MSALIRLRANSHDCGMRPLAEGSFETDDRSKLMRPQSMRAITVNLWCTIPAFEIQMSSYAHMV